MYQLSNYTTKLMPAAMPQRGLGHRLREPAAAKNAANKIVVRALESVKAETSQPKIASPIVEVPPTTMPLQLRPANPLGNLHRLQDLLTEFLHAPQRPI